MAVIYADDFQQWNAASGMNAGTTTPFYPEILGWDTTYQPKYQALGFYPPAGMLGANGGSYSKPTVFYATDLGALTINNNVGSSTTNTYNYPGALGLRRTIKPAGDTLYFSACIEIGGSGVYQGGSIFQFGGEASPLSAFTNTNAMPGNFLYTVGVDANGFFTFNGVSTTVLAFYRPASVKVFVDVVFGPGYMELWLNNERAIRQNRITIPVTEISIAPTDTAYALILLRSLMICDNSGGFGQRMGRRLVQTFPITSTPTIESTIQGTGNPTALQLITKMASGPAVGTDATMLGNLGSPNGYVKNEFGATRSSSAFQPLAAFVSLQAKRLSPAGDGLSLLPFLVVNGSKTYGKLTGTSSLWKMYSVEVPIAANQTFTTLTFGYEQDYKDLNNIWVDDRTKVEVWGDPVAAVQLPGSYLGNTTVVAAPVPMETATFGAYVFNYAVSNLTLTKTDVTNVSYQQDQ